MRFCVIAQDHSIHMNETLFGTTSWLGRNNLLASLKRTITRMWATYMIYGRDFSKGITN